LRGLDEASDGCIATILMQPPPSMATVRERRQHINDTTQ